MGLHEPALPGRFQKVRVWVHFTFGPDQGDLLESWHILLWKFACGQSLLLQSVMQSSRFICS